MIDEPQVAPLALLETTTGLGGIDRVLAYVQTDPIAKVAELHSETRAEIAEYHSETRGQIREAIVEPLARIADRIDRDDLSFGLAAADLRVEVVGLLDSLPNDGVFGDVLDTLDRVDAFLRGLTRTMGVRALTLDDKAGADHFWAHEGGPRERASFRCRSCLARLLASARGESREDFFE